MQRIVRVSEQTAKRIAIFQIGCALLMGVFIAIAITKVNTSSSDVQPWFPDGTPERERLLQFESIFGNQDFWLIALADKEASDRLNKLAEKIRSLVDSGENDPLVAAIRSGGDFLEGRNGDEQEEVKASLSGIFFSLDGEREAIFLRSTEAGFRDRIAVYDLILEAANEVGISADTIRFTGPGYLGVMGDRESHETLEEVTPITFLISAFFAWLLLENLRTAGIALFASGIAAGLPVAVIYFSGNGMTHLLVVVPSLAQLLALSNAVHLIQYYKGAVESGDAHPALTALKKGFRPTVAACVTTGIGFLALQSSSLPAVRSFSFYGTVSVIGAMIVVLTIVPSGLFLLRPGITRNDRIETVLMPNLDRFVRRSPYLVATFLLGILAISFGGIAQLKTEVRMETFFAEDSEFSTNYQWFVQEFGELQTTDVFGAFDKRLTPREQLESVRALVEEFESEEAGLKTFSMAALLPSREVLNQAPPAVISNLVEKAEELNFLRRDNGLSYWKITVFDEPYPDVSSSLTVKKIRASLAKHSNQFAAPNVPWAMTGSTQLFGSAQETLLKELLTTFLLAFVLITPCIILFLKNVRLGLIAMIGNMFPIAVFFGGMGFFGFRIDIATMVIASIAFGIAIDDTVHFLARLREEGETGDPISVAFRKAGAAIFKTTVIISIGMLAFLLSDFAPSRRFAIFTSIVLLLAVVGDLVLLPALMRGPLRRFFELKKT